MLTHTHVGWRFGCGRYGRDLLKRVRKNCAKNRVLEGLKADFGKTGAGMLSAQVLHMRLCHVDFAFLLLGPGLRIAAWGATKNNHASCTSLAFQMGHQTNKKVDVTTLAARSDPS